MRKTSVLALVVGLAVVGGLLMIDTPPPPNDAEAIRFQSVRERPFRKYATYSDVDASADNVVAVPTYNGESFRPTKAIIHEWHSNTGTSSWKLVIYDPPDTGGPACADCDSTEVIYTRLAPGSNVTRGMSYEYNGPFSDSMRIDVNTVVLNWMIHFEGD